MPLVNITYIGATCDECGKQAIAVLSDMYTTGGKTHATEIARKCGFSVGKRGVLCPNCKEKRQS